MSKITGITGMWADEEKHTFGDAPRVSRIAAEEPRHVANYLYADIVEYFDTPKEDRPPIIVTMYYWGHCDALMTTKSFSQMRYLSVFDNSSIKNVYPHETFRADALYEVSVVLSGVTNLLDRPIPLTDEYFAFELEDESKAALMCYSNGVQVLKLLDPKSQILDCRLVEVLDDF